MRIIKHGVDDEKLIEEYNKPVQSAMQKTVAKIASWILCGVLFVFFIFSIGLHFSEDTYNSKMQLKVVASSSMSYKNEKNTYLFANNLNNQLNTFDLIITRPKPDEFELKLYDIIVYEYDGVHIIHRIVGIEEPNNLHPNQRLFITQGDAVGARDRDPVTYEQIKAIYQNERIQFVGSFVFFMRSPAGWLCILLILLTMVTTPIVERQLDEAMLKRLHEIGIVSEDDLIKAGISPRKRGLYEKV